MDNHLAVLAASKIKPLNETKITDEDDRPSPKAFKFGHVDQKMLISRLYSTPFEKAAPKNEQEYVLDMNHGVMGLNKPRFRKLNPLTKAAEPVVCILVIHKG